MNISTENAGATVENAGPNSDALAGAIRFLARADASQSGVTDMLAGLRDLQARIEQVRIYDERMEANENRVAQGHDYFVIMDCIVHGKHIA